MGRWTRPVTTSHKQQARRYAKMSQTAEINKQKLLEAIRQGRWSEQRPKTSELKKARYMDVLDKTPPMRRDQIAQVLNGDSKKTGAILAQCRKRLEAGTVERT